MLRDYIIYTLMKI